jgi:hypothetical protein
MAVIGLFSKRPLNTPESQKNTGIRSPRRRGRGAAAAGPSSAVTKHTQSALRTGAIRHEEPVTRQVEFAGTTLNLVRSTGDQRAEGRL